MKQEHNTLEFTRRIDAPPAQVYYAFTRSTGLREWLADVVEADARARGRLYLWWNAGYFASGLFEQLEPDSQVVFTWRGQNDPHETRVRVRLEPEGNGTALRLQHEGVGEGPVWKTQIEEFKKGWDNSLENLQSVLETGLDLRVYRRPMLGIMIGQVINAEIAARQDLPVDHGIQISGVVEGMGAEAAGLRKDDILVSMDEVKLADFDSLAAILGERQAGDTVSIAAYREGERITLSMQLSGRPHPEVPPTPAGLANALRNGYEKQSAELEVIFANVDDAAAAEQPLAGEWSAQETVAHLIATERDNQIWIASLEDGDELDNLTSNNHNRVRGIVAAFPTTRALLDELKRAERETVAMIEMVSPEVAARKSTYIRLGDTLLDLRLHGRSHYDQIRKALAVTAS